MQLDTENQDWLDSFTASKGRKPRVLHIGNIANNAYNNAKLLNEAGLENDVVCYDYYHIMGCPEWEDAYLSGVISDDFKPDWINQNVSEFVRPLWFVQGPQKLCLDHLLAKRSGRAVEAENYWLQISIANLTSRPAGIFTRMRTAWFELNNRGKDVLGNISRLSRLNPVVVFSDIYNSSFTRNIALNVICASTLMFAWTLMHIGVRIAQKLKKKFGIYSGVPLTKGDSRFDKKVASLVSAWSDEFPEREDVLTHDDLADYQSTTERWLQLFSYYDVVIGYSTDGIYPLLTGTPFFAFEHGTIREIPYQATSQGRNAAMTYRNAEHVFVTNFDCLKSANTLAPGRFTLINHPYDEDHGERVTGWEDLKWRLRLDLDSDFVCLFPTRHDWVPGTGYADKANDVFLLALADLRKAGFRVGAVCCDWGANVAQSKELIAKTGLASHVSWVKPLAMMQFEQMARACDLVADQFKLGAFGGIVFKAMAVGAPILTYLNEARLLEQYAEVPPVVNCATQSSIVEKLGALCASPDRLITLGSASRAWMKRYHGKRDTVNLQLKQFRKLTEKHVLAGF
ncbi:MAG: hypothetical protein V4858_11810 [Pseudomonadota bacterium]